MVVLRKKMRLLLFAVLVCANRSIPTDAAPPSAAAAHPALSPAEAVRTFRLPEGFKIELVASEPDLVNPMTMAVDEQGSVYVSLAHTYRYGPDGAPVDPPSNPIVRLEMGPDGGLVRRTVVASGFDDPVMGLAVRDRRLWATNLNHVFTAELDENYRAVRRQIIVQDAETPWNPFGMYRIALGRDGLLYLSVGDHPTKLSGPDNQVTVRGNTGAVFRFNPDGSKIELLVQGMRAPFSFDIDPFGRLWVLSNGEGNPNRLIHAIFGGDYHFQTRDVDWSWLAGKHPLAPPVYENPPGAHTSVLVYHSSAFPGEYWGNLFVSNWGAHGFPSANHLILRHVLDERGNLIESEPFLTTTDPRFRPTQIALAPDGNLYVLDWYGRDDENDLSGRLYKISFEGGDSDVSRAPRRPSEAKSIAPPNDSSNNKLPSSVPSPLPRAARIAEGEGRVRARRSVTYCWTSPSGLASRNHTIRQRARRRLLSAGPTSAESLAETVGGSGALAAAESLWTLRQSAWPIAPSIMEKGLEHPDWRVRRLAVQLLREQDAHSKKLEQRVDDPDPAVQLEAAVALPEKSARLRAVTQALRAGAAASPRLRYRAALEVARFGDASDFEKLLSANDSDVWRAGLIALDEAFYERVRAEQARKALVKRVLEPHGAPLVELFDIAERWPDEAFRDPVISALKRDLSAAETIGGVAVLRRLMLPSARSGRSDPLTTFWSRVANGDLPLVTLEEKLGTLEILAMDPPTPDRVRVLGQLVRDVSAEVRAEAHRVLVTIGVGDRACTDLCWELLNATDSPLEHRLETVVSLSQIESELCSSSWLKLLCSPSRKLALVALRCLRNHTDRVGARTLLEVAESRLVARGSDFEAALRFDEQSMDASSGSPPTPLTPYAAEEDLATTRQRDELRGRLLKNHANGDPLLGRLVFRSQVCHNCHRFGGQTGLAGPGLEGVAASNSVEYLIDSILSPSKVIKTGFMLERVITRQGRTFVGGVVHQGDELMITSMPGLIDRVPLRDVEERERLNRSPMPSLLENTMSEPELLDLIAYLATLRESRGHEVRD